MPEAAVLTPPAAAPAPTQQFTPPATQTDDFDIGTLIQAAADKAPAKEVQKAKPEPSKPEVQKPEPPKPPEQKAPDAPKPDADKTDKTTPDPEKGKTPFQLVNEYKAQNRELRAKVERLEKQTPKDNPEIVAERDALKKRVAELDEEFKYVDYTKSAEFKEKYDLPYQKLSHRLVSEAQQLIVRGEDGARRGVTSEEFWKVAQAATLDEAVNIADSIFPDNPTKSEQLVGMRNKLAESWYAMQEAKQEFRTKGAEREKAQRERMTAVEQQNKVEFTKLVNEGIERFPQYAKEEDGDEKGNTLLKKGYELADAAMNGEPDNRRDAAARNFIAWFPRLRYKYEQALKTIEEHKTKLAEFQKSVPGGGTVEKEGGAPKEKTMDDLIDERATR